MADAQTARVPGGRRDLAALPKADVHLHLEGSMRPSTLAELADAAGIPVPEIRGYGTFGAFAETYLAACQVLRGYDDFLRLMREVAEDRQAGGAVWIEPSFYLPFYEDRLGPPEEILEWLLSAADTVSHDLGIGIGLMPAGDRTLDPAIAVQQARVAAAGAGRGVVSFGLANDETVGPVEWFTDAFAIAREAGLLCVPHAGELGGAEQVAFALDVLQADRIEHGVRAVDDSELVRRLADRGVCLDVCLTSNLMLSVVDDVAHHPLPRLLDAGVRCSLGTDDSLLFGPSLLQEYELARDTFAFDDDTLAGIARASIDASGAPPALKRDALARIDAWLLQG